VKLCLATSALALLAFTLGWWVGRRTTLDLEAGAQIAGVEKEVAELKNQVIRLTEAVRPPLPAGPDPEKTYAIATVGSPTVGARDAAVTIVEFFDFECPFCSSAVPTLEKILETYPGQVALVFKHNPLPLHRQALSAHKAATAAAKEGRFWEMYKLLFGSQDKLDLDSLRRHAKDLALDLDSFARAMDSKEIADAIQADQVLAGRLGIQGVPSFFVNGRFLAGAQPYEVFRERIEEEIRKN